MKAGCCNVGTGIKAYTYDLNGNLRYDGNRSLTWDEENRLTKANNTANQTIQTLKYDGLGR